MPVIVPPEAYQRWLDPGITEPDELAALLKPYDAEAMAMRPVNPIVNSAAHEDPRCIEPPAQGTLFE
jgi:putative SOS response-associated peptidase YedK